MTEREKIYKGLTSCTDLYDFCKDCPYREQRRCHDLLMNDTLNLLKEQKNEYEKGFNDAMQGKQELMYEGTDGKWHKKDW